MADRDEGVQIQPLADTTPTPLNPADTEKSQGLTQERGQKQELDKAKQKSRRVKKEEKKGGKGGIIDRAAASGSALGSIKKVVGSKRKTKSVTEGVKLGLRLRKEAEENSTSAFITLLLFAAFVDIVDFLDLSVVALIITKPLSLLFGVVLFIFLWGKGKWKVKFFFWVVRIFEILPWISSLPLNMVYVLYAFHVMGQRRDKLLEQAEKAESKK